MWFIRKADERKKSTKTSAVTASCGKQKHKWADNIGLQNVVRSKLRALLVVCTVLLLHFQLEPLTISDAIHAKPHERLQTLKYWCPIGWEKGKAWKGMA